MDDMSGRVIRGYELRDRIGTGGFGAVYSAFQPMVGRDVAIKVILPDFANHPEFIRRFESEAQVVARLEHPFIIPLYDYWREPSSAYLVMRLLSGGSLDDLIESNQTISLETATRIVDQIAAALAVAHRAGIVHRDIKPANILMDGDGNAYLADFGIAKDIAANAGFDEDDDTIGSPAYLAPEQITQRPISPQTDIYAMGLVLFSMLTGQHPFDTSSIMKVLRQQLEQPVPSVFQHRHDLPEGIDDIIAWATAKEPAERYTNILTMAADLRNLTAGITAAAASGEGFGNVVDFQRDTTERVNTMVISDEVLEQNPYKGLRPFAEADAADFFGRESLIANLIDSMAQVSNGSRFLAVVGPSGSGKSSVVHAGLVPALRRGALRNSAAWFYTSMSPGTSPLAELESALLSVAAEAPPDMTTQLMDSYQGLHHVVSQIVPENAELVLVIDQFEEMFTVVADESLRQHALDSIHYAVTHPASRLRIIVTIRADFYDKPLLYSGFGELMQRRTEVVLPLSPSELEQAIVGPAERVGLRLDKQLVTEIINDVSAQPGALPLLQFALTELFDERTKNTLSVTIYQQTGGVSGALARRADEVFMSLDTPGQKAARQLFLQLVALGEGTDDTRRRIDWKVVRALQDQFPAIPDVIDTFGKYRLLTFDRDPLTRTPTVEVAHEALIQQWRRLRDWLSDAREDLRIQRRIENAAREWLNTERDPSFLATGMRLSQFEEWFAQTDLALTANQRSYLEASIEQHHQREAAEQARIEREERLERRQRRALVAVAVVLLIGFVAALGFGLLALQQSEEAEDAQRAAEASAADARANARLAQVAQQSAEANAESARLQEQVARTNALQAQENLEAAQENAAEAQSLALATSSQLALADNNTDLAILLAIEANNIEMAPALAQRSLFEAAYAPGTRYRFDAHTDWVRKVAFSTTNEYIASAAQDGKVILYEVATGRVRREFGGHAGQVFAVTFNRDSSHLASGGEGGRVIIHDVLSGFDIRTYEAPDAGTVFAVDYSPNNAILAAGYESGEIILWSLRSDTIIQRVQAHDARIWDLEFTADGLRIVTASDDATARVFDALTGAELVVFDEHPQRIHSVDIADGRNLVATAGAGNNSIYLWDLNTGESRLRIAGHADQVYDAEFSPNERELISSSQDATIRVWDVDTGLEVERLQGHAAAVRTIAVSPYGGLAASGSYDMSVRLWDLNNGAVAGRSFGHTDDIYDIAVSADGTQALSGAWDNTVILWNLQRNSAMRRMTGHDDWIRDVDFAPDMETGISGSYDQTVIVWDLITGEQLARLAHDGRVWAVAYSPTGEYFASGSQDGIVKVWDAETYELVWQLEGHPAWVRGIDFSPDGTQLLSVSGVDVSIRIWDLSNGQQIAELYGHGDWLWSASWSPTGEYFITSASDTRIILWDAETFEIVRRYEGHTGPVNKVDFSPDGRTFASGSTDGTVRLWDVESGAELRRFLHTGAGVWSVAFHPNGQEILSGTTDAVITQWRISTVDELFEWIGENRYLRDLTCYEREQNRIDPQCE